MKKTNKQLTKLLALTLSSLMVLTVFSSCKPKEPKGGEDKTSAGILKSAFSAEDSTVILTDTGELFLGEDGIVYGTVNKTAEKISYSEKIMKMGEINTYLGNPVFFIAEGDLIYTKDSGQTLKISTIPIRLNPEMGEIKAFFKGYLTDYLITTDGKLYSVKLERDTEKGEDKISEYTLIRSDISEGFQTRYFECFLTTDGVLYQNGSFSAGRKDGYLDVENWVKTAENVKTVIPFENQLYYISASGELFAAGIDTEGGNSYYLGTDTTDSFVKIAASEKVKFLLRFGRTKLIVGESGKTYVIGNEADIPAALLNGKIENIDKVTAIVTDKKAVNDKTEGVNYTKYSYAIKREGAPWRLCLAEDNGEFKAGETVDIYSLPEWK